jgi:hypothetical protein
MNVYAKCCPDCKKMYLSGELDSSGSVEAALCLSTSLEPLICVTPKDHGHGPFRFTSQAGEKPIPPKYPKAML